MAAPQDVGMQVRTFMCTLAFTCGGRAFMHLTRHASSSQLSLQLLGGANGF